MEIPGYQRIMLPLLKLAGDGKTHQFSKAVEALGSQFELSTDDLSVLIESGTQPLFYNRVGWARTYLKKAGLLEDPTKGYFRITEAGKQLLAENLEKIDNAFLRRYPSFVEFQKFARATQKKDQKEDRTDLTPEEVLEAAYQEIRNGLAEELLQVVYNTSPGFFEALVVELLSKLGYGRSLRELARVVGQSGDGGIDGVIDEDRLGLDRIYIQAKKWNPEVKIGSPEIQKFAGALLGRHAQKGVFITTAKFAAPARKYVEGIGQKVVLIDGEQLTELMIDYGVGLTTKTVYEIKTIDYDSFSESP